MSWSSVFGAANFAPQSAMEILKSTNQLPIALASDGAALDALAWGIGAANWQQPSPSTSADSPGIPMRKELRTLVAASFDVYMRLQRLYDDKNRLGRELVPEEIVRASREYREALKTCIFELEDRNNDADEELLDLLKVSLALWHLCELLVLQRRARDDKQLAYDLALWLQEHYGSAKMEELDAETQRLRSLTTTQNAEQDASFWPTVYSLVAMGCGAQAWAVLSLHSSFRAVFTRETTATIAARESFQSIQRLLLCMPGGSSRQQIEWQNWRDACQYQLQTDTYVRGHGELKKLLDVMTADPQTLDDLSATWFELMMARLFLEEPKAIANRFEFLMANCFKVFHGDNAQDTMNNFDCIVLAILEYDVQTAVQDIHALGFHWMSAHLTDLLAKSNVIAGDEVVEQYGCGLQEYLVLQYSMEIALCRGTWQFTTSYAEHCSVYGLAARRATIAKEPITCDAMAQRLSNYCQGKKGMLSSQRKISLRRAQDCKRDRAFAAALQWALRDNHLDETDGISELVLNECEHSGSLTPLYEAVEFLESQPAMAARTKTLKWLVMYRELNLVLEDRVALKMQLKESYPAGSEDHEQAKSQVQFVSKQAASRLQDLIASPMAPRRLRAVLLGHIDALLSDSPVVFSSEQLFDVMAFVQSIDRAFDRHDFEKNAANRKLKQRVQARIARNLSDAILVEGGKGSFTKSHASRAPPPQDSSARSFASLTANLQLFANGPTSGLVDYADDEAME